MTKESLINVLSVLSSNFEFFSYIEDDSRNNGIYDLVVRFGNSDTCSSFYVLFHYLGLGVNFYFIDNTTLGFIFYDSVPVIVGSGSIVPSIK